MNELLWIGFTFLDLIMVLFLFRIFGKESLYALIVFNLILCNIQVMKTVELFGLTATLGNVLYAGVFLVTDILSEFYGKKEAQKGVFLGFAALILTTIYMQIAVHFVPAAEDFAQPHLAAVFGFLPRVALAGTIAYLISQFHDIWAFHFWKRITGERMLWVRNNASTLVSQFLDSLVFCTIAFYGVFSFSVWLEILLTTYVLKVVVAVLDTPFIYFAKYRLFPQQKSV